MAFNSGFELVDFLIVSRVLELQIVGVPCSGFRIIDCHVVSHTLVFQMSGALLSGFQIVGLRYVSCIWKLPKFRFISSGFRKGDFLMVAPILEPRCSALDVSDLNPLICIVVSNMLGIQISGSPFLDFKSLGFLVVSRIRRVFLFLFRF